MKNNIIEIEEAGIFQCCDCGAYADKEQNIKHYSTCVPGESKKWEDYYSKNNEE